MSLCSGGVAFVAFFAAIFCNFKYSENSMITKRSVLYSSFCLEISVVSLSLSAFFSLPLARLLDALLLFVTLSLATGFYLLSGLFYLSMIERLRVPKK